MPNLPISVDFILFDGFSNMVLASGLEPLRAANDISGKTLYTWRFLSAENTYSTSSSDIEMKTQNLNSIEQSSSRSFVVAGFGVRKFATPAISSALRRTVRSTDNVGALDMGSWLLATAGLLDGYQATSHWEELTEFAESFPNVDVVDDRYVMDRSRLTAGGATAVLALMISMIRADHGAALSFDVTNMFVYDTEIRNRRNRGALHISLENRSPQLIRAIDTMRRNLDEPIKLTEIADTASVSLRTLTRIFLRELDMSPGQYYLSTRLLAARRYAVETKFSCSEIAARTGYSSSAALARAFSAHFGSSIRDHRAKSRT